MYDPLHAYVANNHHPIQRYNELDEERYAQLYGETVRIPGLWSKSRQRLGKLLIRIGEKLTGECSSVELSRESI